MALRAARRFAADIREQADGAVGDDEIDRLYAEHFNEVRQAQTAQRRLLRELIGRHRVEKVHCEGLTDSDMPVYGIIIEHIGRRRLSEHELSAGPTGLDETLLRIGAAGQLLAAGELACVLPAEDEKAYAQADPLIGNGQLMFDGQANDARQAAIVQRLLDGAPLAVVILGGALSEQVRRLSGGRCEYIRVKKVNWPAGQQTGDCRELRLPRAHQLEPGAKSR